MTCRQVKLTFWSARAVVTITTALIVVAILRGC